MGLLNLGAQQPVTTDMLIDAYTPGAAFFASQRGTVFAESVTPVRAGGGLSPTAGARSALLAAGAAGYERPVVIGVLPYQGAAGPRLSLAPSPLRVVYTHEQPRSGRPPVGAPLRVTPLPGRAAYARAVACAVGRIGAGELEKVVLARTLCLDYADPVPVGPLLRRLAHGNTHGYTFAVGSPARDADGAAPAGPVTLIGASPELLVAKSGEMVTSWPLAGSAPRSRDPEEDRVRAVSLLASDKDLREHAFVVRAVADGLRPYCKVLTVPDRPVLTATPALWHLGSHIVGELRDSRVSSLELATALHPTPAVCGTPTGRARDAIAELEQFDRGAYAGAVGWCDANGDGEWAVAIRCAEVGARSVRLFAGAGIVAGSSPRAEVRETAAKFRTMLAALGDETAASARPWV